MKIFPEPMSSVISLRLSDGGYGRRGRRRRSGWSVTHAVERAIFLGLILLMLPLLTVISLAIIAAGQSPLFVQKRVGQGGRDFNILKFRTIPEGGWEPAAARASQSYVARLRLAMFKGLSTVMRATGLDELPQFINIVRGDMRLIGPRPLTRSDFMALPAAREARCAVPPGITGLAQVNGGQQLDSRSKLALDLYYIDHGSWAMTAEIVFRSLCRVSGLTLAVETTSHTALARALHHLSVRTGDTCPEQYGDEPRAA